MWGGYRRQRINEEAGFALIEALIGAVVLVVIAVAMLGAIDRAQKTSGFAKNKSVAAALAEQDQARLRGLPADSLSTYAGNHAPTRTVTINGLNYNVASTVDWVRDTTGGTVSCTNDGKQADYLKLTSTVSANSIQPVSLTSLSAPPLAYSASRGTLVVQVNDGATPAVGVQGVTVNISGPVSLSGTTNSLGCAVFGFLPAGDYDVAIYKPGYVDYAGTTTAIHQSKTLAGGSLTTASFIYDAAGAIKVNFETDISTTSTPVLSPSRGYNASGFNSLVPGNQTRSTADTNPPAPSVSLTNLFPFRTAYNTWAGRCAGANPKTAIPNNNWFNTGQIGADDNAIVPPGDTSSIAVSVRQPALDVRVKDASNTYLNGVNVYLEPQDTTCMPASPQLWTTAKNPQASAANADGWITKQQYNFGGSIGNVTYDPGVPFGRYVVCAEAQTGSPLRWRSYTSSTINVNAAAGVAASDLRIPTTGSSSRC